MSDFTYGNLIRSEHKALAKKYLGTGSYLMEINSNWVCMLSEDDKYFMDMSEKTFSDNILELSTHVPVFFFAHPEDHGFGYAILKDKEKLSSLFVSFEVEDHAGTFDHINTGNFKLLGYSDEQIKALDELLTDEDLDETMWSMADSFMEILGIGEMSFVAWDYAHLDEERGDELGDMIIAKG